MPERPWRCATVERQTFVTDTSVRTEAHVWRALRWGTGVAVQPATQVRNVRSRSTCVWLSGHVATMECAASPAPATDATAP